jgi:hypothetical protein
VSDLGLALLRLDALRIDLEEATERAVREASSNGEHSYATEAGWLSGSLRLALMDVVTIRAFVAAANKEHSK